MKACFLLLFFFLPGMLLAQKPLSNSQKTSKYRYIYRITPGEALVLYKNGLQKLDDKYLHSMIDSIPADGVIPRLSNGNYLTVQAVGNRIRYDLIAAGDIHLKLISNKRDLAFVLHNKAGEMIPDANVHLDGRSVPYDKATQSYRLNNHRKPGKLHVLYAGTSFYFSLERSYRRTKTAGQFVRMAVNRFPIKYITRSIRKWKNNSYYQGKFFDLPVPHESKFRGFLVFSKPVYKPLDTVKLKAFVVRRNGKGLNKKLMVRLTDPYSETDTIVATIKPYRPGGFTHEFVLNDSLDLDLDNEYLVTLEENRSRKYGLADINAGLADNNKKAQKRKVVIRKKFSYEEYELENLTFSSRSEKHVHNRGSIRSIFLKARDENDLPVLDGRLQIVVLPHFGDSIEFTGPKAFIADTLWNHTQSLDAIGETRIDLPDSIFPNASFSYQVECILRNSNNERHTQTLRGQFIDQPRWISFHRKKDSLQIALRYKEQFVEERATVYELNDLKDTLRIISMLLPAALKVNPYAASYQVIAGKTVQEYRLNDGMGMVTAMISRTSDSVFAFVDNALRLPVWYTLFEGNKPVAKGYGDSLSLNFRTRSPRNYFLSLQYVFGNRIHNEEYTIPYRDKQLNLTVNAPRVIYPGQTAAIEVQVRDAANKAVEGADVTAYAFTKKFPQASMRLVPYLGKVYPFRKWRSELEEQDSRSQRLMARLNWDRWSKQLGLDTIEYYKFLYPAQLYRNTESVRDSITQIAPFVVIRGELQPIHLLYIDGRPVFFSKAQHLQRYSFKIQPGKHSLRIRTHDRIITLKEVEVPKGVKTIISINADTSNKAITTQMAPDTLTSQERLLMTKYTILVGSNYGEHLGYIEQGENKFLLPRSGTHNYGGPALVGPLLPQMADLVVHQRYRQPFEVEGGYLYHIQQGLIKQKQVNTNISISKWLSKGTPPYDFSDLVLTGDEVENLWSDYLDKRSHGIELFMNSPVEKKGSGQLQIAIQNEGKDTALFVKNIFLFRENNTDFIHVYKGGARYLGYLYPGVYRLLLLLKDDKYLVKDSILVGMNGLNYYLIDADKVKPEDSISRKLARIIRHREISSKESNQGLDTLSVSFYSGYLDTSAFSKIVYGWVRDIKNLPVGYASVQIKNTLSRTVTDADGYYSLRVPENGTLIFSAVGFKTVERSITEGQLDLVLSQQGSFLQEVIVTGFRSEKRASYTGSFDQVLQGRAPGLLVKGAAGSPGNFSSVTIRGMASTGGASMPLIVVDGVPYSGDLDALDPAGIINVSMLRDASALALYGSRAANGVVLVTTSKSGATGLPGMEQEMAPVNSIRKRFRDDAYWQPALKTDKEGKVRFDVTFPDDITNWRTYAIAMGSKRRTGFGEGTIRSFRPVSATLAIPQFAVEGDRFNVIGKILNYGNDSIRLTRRIRINDQLIKEGPVGMRSSFLDTIATAVEGADSIGFYMEIQKEDGYFDGEQRSIPVFGRGVMETTGIFAALEGDTSLDLQFDPALGEITIHAEASLFPVLLDEMEKIRKYKYLCNEQLASKLKALLMQKKVCALMKKDFKWESAIVDIISRLNNNRTGVLWGWWTSNEAAPWISLHVAEALLWAEKEGYKINLPKSAMIDFLVFNMENHRVSDKLFSLQLLEQLKAKVDYKTYIDSLELTVRKTSLYDRLRLLELKQKIGMQVRLDSLVAQAKTTMFGNLYWGEEGYQFFDNSIQNTVLMYRMLRSSGDTAALKKIRNYFLEKRKNGQWRNTYESSLILETILPDLVMDEQAARPSVITLSGASNEVVRSFPYHAGLKAGEKISIRKEGGLPVYFTAYQQSWNKKPAAVADAFTVTSSFLRNKDTVTRLKAGEPVTLEVKVVVKADADYIMIEIPIPAGCSYRDKPQPLYNNEVHREYEKNKVNIFCKSLPPGSYNFSIPLTPRYTGKYHLNPAKAEMMYFPVFYGREAMREVDIE
ncbi:MAG TPA: alpha-2-macroglobulin family protein [Flavisolibacter sp.]|nr:alpha-2-macroglobulin family protein [Flavisolibacter sp.]